MANSLLKLTVESSEYDAKLKKAAEGIRHLADVAHKGGGDFAGLEKSELEFIKALGDMETKSRSASGQVRELSTSYKELKVIYDELNEVEKADEGGKALAASLETLKQRAQEAKAGLDAATKSLEDNGDAGKENSSILEQLSSKFVVNVDAIKLFNLGLNAAKIALDVAKDAFFNNEENLDEWGRTVESCESVYKGFLNSINTGDISGFLSNIQTITQAARDAYDALDELATFNAFNKANIAGARANLTGSIADFREGTGSKQAVSDASNKLIKELETKQRLQEEAYKKVIAKVAVERGVNANDLLKVMQGTYGSFKELKDLQYTGRNTRIVSAGGTFASGPVMRTITEAVPANERERLAQAVKHLNDTEIDNFQSIAEAAKMTQVEINNQRKMVSRVLNGRQGNTTGNSTSRTRSSGGGRSNQPSYMEGSLSEQQALVSELTKKWHDAAGTVKDDYLVQLVAAESLLQKMKENDALDKWAAGYNIRKGGINVDMSVLSGSPSLDAWWNNRKNSTFTGLTKEGQKALENQQKKYQKQQQPEKKEDKSFVQVADQLNGGISNMVSSLEQMGIDIPEGFQSILGGISGVIGVLQAIMIIAESIEAMQSVGTFLGIFKNGGIVPHAANGYYVPGNNYSGDRTPILANAGELILNKAQQGNLASQLAEGGMMGNLRLEAVVTGENLRFVLNNNGKRTGRGEYVQTNRR